jgi:hypothetical protein
VGGFAPAKISLRLCFSSGKVVYSAMAGNKASPLGQNTLALEKSILPPAGSQPFRVKQDWFIAIPPLHVSIDSLKPTGIFCILRSLLQPLSTGYEGQPSLATVVCLSDQRCVTKRWLQEVIDDYHSKDDVFRQEFLSGVIFVCAAKHDIEITPGAGGLLKSLGTTWTDILEIEVGGTVPPAGPYVAYAQRLFEVWKLYADVQGAFMASLVPDLNGYGEVSTYRSYKG